MAASVKTPGFIRPDWPAPANVHALATLRTGGYSTGSYTSFNLAAHTGDDPAAVSSNRRLLREYFRLPGEPLWLQQVHGSRLVKAEEDASESCSDGSWTDVPGRVCAVMTADCLPLLICDRAGSRVAAVHAGWRGLHAGVITSAVNGLEADPAELIVWLGPAIGPQAFEVGGEVCQAFCDRSSRNSVAFRRTDASHWLCDLYLLARIELASLGVTSVYGGGFCTFSEKQRFFSYRRDGQTGRMASLVWFGG